MSYLVELILEKNFKIRIKSNHPDYLYDMKQDFSMHVPNYFWQPKYKAGLWDGKVHFISEACLMPYGLLLDFLRLHKQKYPELKIKADEGIKRLFKGEDINIRYDLSLYPRPYQKESIEVTLSKSKGIIRSATASGKSIVIAYIIKNLLDNRDITKVRRSLVIVPSTSLVEQFKGDMIDYGIPEQFIGKVYSGHKEWNNAIVMSTWQTLKNNHDKISMYDCMIGDECLYPDTEILTNKGWKVITDLKKDEKVAQWNDSEDINFIHPIKYIEKDFDGKMIHWKGKHTDILSTPNHQQPYKTIYPNKEFNRKKEIKDIKLHYTVKIPTSGNNNGNSELTPLMRFKIMTQADGHITPKKKTKDYRIVQFNFAKERKIKRFFSIMKEVKLRWKEIETDYRNKNKRRRFQVQAPLDISKSLWDIIDLENVNSDFVDEFIDELTRWDGSRKDILYYSTKDSKNADFIQAICTLGGWKCSRTIQNDNRKESYNSIHRLYFFKNSFRETQQIKRSEIPYKGKVYCVRVPFGNIIIRRNNKVMITGNCHQVKAHELKNIFSKSKAKYRLGFTGTLPPHPTDLMNTKAFLGPILKEFPSGLLAEQGYIAKCNIIIHEMKYPIGVKVKSENYIDIKQEVFKDERRLRLLEKIVKDTEKNILILVSYISEGEMLEKMFNRRSDREVMFLSGRDKTELREEWRQKMIHQDNIALIATYGIFQQGINIPNLKDAILASPTKSKIRTLQSVGRTLRAFDNEEATIHDIIDDVKFLYKHGQKRIEYYKSEGFSISYLK